MEVNPEIKACDVSYQEFMFTWELNAESGLAIPTIDTLKGKTKEMGYFYLVGIYLNHRKQFGEMLSS